MVVIFYITEDWLSQYCDKKIIQKHMGYENRKYLLLSPFFTKITIFCSYFQLYAVVSTCLDRYLGLIGLSSPGISLNKF